MKTFVLSVLLATAACGRWSPETPSPEEFRRRVAGADWQLVELEGAPAPLGNGARRATIRFAPDSTRVDGFSGCNRYFSSYTLGSGAEMRFGPVGMTKMACPQGMDLEQRLAQALARTERYELSENRITLRDATAALAVFSRDGT